jgi:2-C-methyl-D-erythritol 2,4-cyclodiphosphate synthase
VTFRAGFGYDLHRLTAKRRLYLGGIRIPNAKGLAGHSDGDCLVHAVIDALLGALGEGDIGRLFPDTDIRYKDIRSIELLRKVVFLVHDKGFRIVNLDTVIVAQEPKIAPHVLSIKSALCPVLGIKTEELGIKAKTNEGMGLIGGGGAIACWAVALLAKRRSRPNSP